MTERKWEPVMDATVRPEHSGVEPVRVEVERIQAAIRRAKKDWTYGCARLWLQRREARHLLELVRKLPFKGRFAARQHRCLTQLEDIWNLQFAGVEGDRDRRSVTVHIDDLQVIRDTLRAYQR